MIKYIDEKTTASSPKEQSFIPGLKPRGFGIRFLAIFHSVARKPFIIIRLPSQEGGFYLMF